MDNHSEQYMILMDLLDDLFDAVDQAKNPAGLYAIRYELRKVREQYDAINKTLEVEAQ